jgi:hypothetical protein
MAGIHLDAVAELHETSQRVEEALGAVECLDRKVRTGSVADEEGVAGQHEPRLVGAGAIDDRKRAMLGSVAGRMNHTNDDVAELELSAVRQRLMRERRLGCSVHVHGYVFLEREAAVAGDVVGMGMGLENADELDLSALALIQILLDRVRRIDQDGDSGLLVADEVGGTPQVVVDELLEEHNGDGSNPCGYIS